MKAIRDIFSIILTFLYIFTIPFNNFYPSFVNSTTFIGVVMLIYFLLSKPFREKLFFVLKDRRIQIFFTTILIIIFYSILVSLLHQTNEFSIIKPFSNFLLKLGIGLFLFIFFKTEARLKFSVLELVVISFVIQTFIQLASIISPTIKEFLNVFRLESAVELANSQYFGTRALSIAGSAFFGLTISYGLVILLYVLYKDELLNHFIILKNNIIIYLLVFVILIIGALLVGRFSVIGIALALGYLLVSEFMKKMKYEKEKAVREKKTNIRFRIFLVALILSFVSVLLFGFYLIANYSTETVPDVFYPFFAVFKYLFSGTYNLIHYGEFRITSLRDLQSMYFKVPLKTLLAGDGYYTDLNGRYYMDTDVGVMRNILFFGIPGMFILSLFQIEFFDWSKKTNKIKNVVILLFLVLCHLKGEVIGFGQMINSILFILFLENYFKEKITVKTLNATKSNNRTQFQ